MCVCVYLCVCVCVCVYVHIYIYALFCTYLLLMCHRHCKISLSDSKTQLNT